MNPDKIYLDLQIKESGSKTMRHWYRYVYLKSEHWQILRNAKLREVGRICEKCKSNKNIQVHHLNYKEIFNVKLSDLQVLCEKCHKAEHEPLETSSVVKKPLTKAEKKREKKKLESEGLIPVIKDKLKKQLSLQICHIASKRFSHIVGFDKIPESVNFLLKYEKSRKLIEVLIYVKSQQNIMEQIYKRFLKINYNKKK